MPADYLSHNLVNAISWDSSTLQQAENADPLLKAIKTFFAKQRATSRRQMPFTHKTFRK
jgi:hypothetical protein